MWTIELARLFALAAECANELAFVVVLIDEARPVSIADVQIASRPEREIGRAVLGLAAIRTGLVGVALVGVADLVDRFPIERGLHDEAASRVAEVQELRRAFLRDVEA